MLIIYEYAACVLAAVILGTLLFAAGAACVMLFGLILLGGSLVNGLPS